jgi:subtilisin family serine protease
MKKKREKELVSVKYKGLLFLAVFGYVVLLSVSLIQADESRVVNLELKNPDMMEMVEKEIGEENVIHVVSDNMVVSVSEEELTRLENNPGILSVTPEIKLKVFLQDSVDIINASDVWTLQVNSVNLTGINQTVCVLDTGINYSHPDLSGRYLGGYDFINNDSDPLDDHGHGTHVAGIVGASGGISGVGKGVGIIAVKVMDSNGDGTSTSLNQGIDWCIDNAGTYNITVITMSLGVDCNTDPANCFNVYCNSALSSTTDLINNATLNNITVVAASGNDGNTTHIPWPSCITNATSVGATDKSDNVASYSNRNNITDLFAPGSSINSTDHNAVPTLYRVDSGTSMATPHVAGAVAVIKQVLALTNQFMNPSAIVSLLNSTGKQINDSSGNGLNFSRINLHSAILSLDNIAPNVTLVSPKNNNRSIDVNQTLVCNASDWQLTNITLYLWNSSSGIFYNKSANVSGDSSEVSFNVTNLGTDNYYWNCIAYDNESNSAFSVSNFSLIIKNISVTLDSPANDTYIKQSSNFTCLSSSVESNGLTNVTLYIWNSSSSLNHSETKSISGESNSTVFNHTFVKDDSYMWNCLGYNNNSESSFAVNNYTITHDSANPVINLDEPEDSSSYESNSKSVTFTYNVSDSSTNISNCSLIVNDKINTTDSSITESTEQSFTKTFGPGDYDWKINCADSLGNQANSSQRNFQVTAPDNESSSSSSSSGGAAPATTSLTHAPTKEQVAAGYKAELNAEDKIKFSDENSIEHTLTLNDVGWNSVSVTVESEPISLILTVGEVEKLNLTSQDYYDVYIKLESVSENKANITIRTIHEEIPKQVEAPEEEIPIVIFNESGNESGKEEQASTVEEPRQESKKWTVLIVILIIVIVFLFVIKGKLIKKLLIKKSKKRKMKREK